MVDLKQKLKGVFGFPVTPFKNDLSLDLPALDKVVEMMMGHPFCAIVVTGGTGEIYSLSPQEAITVVERAVKVVNGRMPVVAGVGYSTVLASEMARGMEKAGADALLVTQTLVLDAGLSLALYLGWRLARAYAPRAGDALRVLAPWAGLATVLFGFGIWIFLQPMQMRGVASSVP